MLKSRWNEYAALRCVILDICRTSGYSPEFGAILELTVKEAFVNAIIHGNREQEDLPVTVTFDKDAGGRGLLVSVSDCGIGFSPEDLPDPSEACRLMKTSGRGVYLIRSHAEIVEARRNDSGFTFSFRCSPY
ncbi:MAG: ATP-binding protein [Chlorobiaceae bacterium]|nr:ATP-binding protein [Chlorobiaceae bacterium]MCF8216042.1 ATP-binding protein [Chlorobium sp.]